MILKITKDELAQEIWKPIEGFIGYEVSNMGRVRGLDRHVSDRRAPCGTKFVKGRIFRPSSTKGKGIGYYFVGLRTEDKRAKYYTIHKLVASAFKPNPDNLSCIDHIDGNIHNNKASNLDWVTYAENIKRSFDNNLRTLGEDIKNI